MQHIERIIWKSIDWYPESPDQYPDGLPVPKPEMTLVDLGDGRRILVQALQLGGSVDVWLVDEGGNTGQAPSLSIPADRLRDMVDALLYVHRRTHEHEYTGPDAGLANDD